MVWKGVSMWGNLIKSFSQNIKLSRKRRVLRTFECCFSGKDAIHWLQTYIDVHQKSSRKEVTEATIRWLLERLLESGFIVCIWKKERRRGRKYGSRKNLYRFSFTGAENENKTHFDRLFTAIVVSSPQL